MSDDGEAEDVPPVERVVMVVSALFTLSLFAFAVWHAVTGPGAVAPAVAVTGSEPGAGGVHYTVVLRNPGDVGLVSVTVEAGCTDPPTELIFENVPAGGRRTGTVVCPPGTTNPSISAVTWIQE